MKTKKFKIFYFAIALYNVIDTYGMDNQPINYNQQLPTYNQPNQIPQPPYVLPSAPNSDLLPQPVTINIHNQIPISGHHTGIYLQHNIFSALQAECTNQLNKISIDVNSLRTEIEKRRANTLYRFFAYWSNNCVSLRKLEEKYAIFYTQHVALTLAQATLIALQSTSIDNQNLFLQNMLCAIGKTEKTFGQHIKEWGIFSAKCAAFAIVLLWISSMNQVALYMCEGLFFSGCLVILMIYGLQAFSNILKPKSER